MIFVVGVFVAVVAGVSMAAPPPPVIAASTAPQEFIAHRENEQLPQERRRESRSAVVAHRSHRTANSAVANDEPKVGDLPWYAISHVLQIKYH